MWTPSGALDAKIVGRVTALRPQTSLRQTSGAFLDIQGLADKSPKFNSLILSLIPQYLFVPRFLEPTIVHFP
jgi:hypothetical protein